MRYTIQTVSDDFDGSWCMRISGDGEMLADADTHLDAELFIEEFEKRDKRIAELEVENKRLSDENNQYRLVSTEKGELKNGENNQY